MAAERKKLPTAPDILNALSGLAESAPPATAASAPPATRKESFPVSGAVPITHDNVVKLPFSLGSVIGGKYEIIGVIGAGGVGYVVSAMHLELGEMVALKFLREESLVHEQIVERFSREARAAARIKSEYVARVFDVGSLPNGIPFIVMEYLHGKDLADVLRERGKLPIKVVVEYILQACEALASAHASGIVHRDIKPENLFLTRQGEGVEIIKVLDFGISKTALSGNLGMGGMGGGERRFAKTMMPMGTPAYMSPEQIRSAGEVDHRTDIWALGCVLFEMLTGACVFDAPTLMQLGAAILERDPVPLRQLLSDAPAELEAVVQRCLEKDVNKRYQSVAELAVALYPFAPRRARISVERSNQILRSKNPSGVPVDLGSVAPPPLRSSARPTERADATIVSAAPAPLLSTAEPTSAELAALRGNKKTKVWAAAGLALAIALSALIAKVAHHDDATSSSNASPKSALPVNATPAPAPAPAGKPSAEPTPSAAHSAPEAARTSEPASTADGASSSSKGKAPRPFRGKLRPAPNGKVSPSANGDDEFDVGY